MSDDYKIEDKSYPIRKFGPNSKWKTVTVSVEEWDKLMAVVEAAKLASKNKTCDGFDGSCISQHYPTEKCDCGVVVLKQAIEALEK